MLRILALDTETTGLPKSKRIPLSEQPKIIEIGIVVFEGDNIILKDNQLLNPGELITPEITKITGITNEDLADQMTFAQYLPTLRGHFDGVDAMVMHNAPFDYGMLGNELNRLGVEVNKSFPWPKKLICSVQEYYHVFGFRPSLQVLYKKIMGTDLAQTHRALDDAMALTEILIRDNFSGRI